MDFDSIKTVMESIKAKYNSALKFHPLATIFITSVIVSIVIFAISTLITSGETFSNAFFRDKKDSFMDYFNSISDSVDHPYTKHRIIYPPLITLFYEYLGTITIPYMDPRLPLGLALQLRNSQSGIMLFVTLMALTFFILYNLFKKITVKYGKISVILSALLCISFPFIYCFERGNSLIWSVLFSLLYILNYKSDNKHLRYMSYVCLGIASGIKVYCAILGLLIIKEHRIKEIAIATTIGVIFVILPFIFTDGSPLMYLSNSINVTGELSKGSSFDNINSVVHFFDGVLDEAILSAITLGLCAFLYGLCVLISYYGRNVKEWELVTLLCCAISLGLGTGVLYNLCLFSIPLVLFLRDEHELTKTNVLYITLFALLFIWIPAPHPVMIDYVRYLHTIPMFIILIVSAKNLISYITGNRISSQSEKD